MSDQIIIRLYETRGKKYRYTLYEEVGWDTYGIDGATNGHIDYQAGGYALEEAIAKIEGLIDPSFGTNYIRKI